MSAGRKTKTRKPSPEQARAIISVELQRVREQAQARRDQEAIACAREIERVRREGIDSDIDVLVNDFAARFCPARDSQLLERVVVGLAASLDTLPGDEYEADLVVAAGLRIVRSIRLEQVDQLDFGDRT